MFVPIKGPTIELYEGLCCIGEALEPMLSILLDNVYYEIMMKSISTDNVTCKITMNS